MLPDPNSLAQHVSAETGFDFVGSAGRDNEGNRWLEIRPADHSAGQTFVLRTIVGWRRLEVHFRPGDFAGDLVSAMATADATGRRAFRAILDVCREAGAEITLMINDVSRAPEDDTAWTTPWRNFGLIIKKGMLAINEGRPDEDSRQIELWTTRTAVAVLALLPLEPEKEDPQTPDTVGLPEGAKSKIEVNRYERDRRNRAAALAIYGFSCQACNLDMGERYGSAATNLIEVHHTTPVSEIGPGYIIDPKTDLVPLCPNCHSVAHRRSPPFTVDELRQMLRLM